MPFLNRAGFVGEVEPFDFAVEGVTAISCDIVRLRSTTHDLALANDPSAQIRILSERIIRHHVPLA